MSKITFTPKNGRLLIKPEEKEKQTATGLYIPDSKDDEKPTTGIVIKGDAEYPEGARVLFNKFSFDEFQLEGEKYYTVATNFILGIF